MAPSEMVAAHSTNIPSLSDARASLTLSVVIVNWNTCDLLVKCLHTLYADLDHAGRPNRPATHPIAMITSPALVPVST